MITIEDGNTNLAKRNSGTLNKNRAPLSVGQLELALLKRYPREDAEEWDRTGLRAGDPAVLITGVAVALDATPEAVRAAERAGANVLLTHHPVFIEAPDLFAPTQGNASMAGATVYEAIKSGVALMNFHTALDASVEATRMFPRMMSLQFERLLKPLSTDSDKGYAILCTPSKDESPIAVSHLAARVTSVFGRQPRVWGDFDVRVKSIVIGNGSANSIVDACLAAHAECLICGEIGYHKALEASQAGLCIIEMGHDVSELPLCALLAQATAEVGVPQESITILDQSQNWRHPEATRI